ncbi:MAG TPA: PRC-barrel domain-containing protein [Gaiellaceae bacterium]|nr:PRC-barrel domain-containing protein [Gaiellaceae bacterium]
MPDPVSWKAVEKGWAVYDREGEQVGTVHEIAGDTEHDIFDGFGVKTGTLGPVKYVPAEIVASIAVGEVRLEISGNEVAPLDDMRAEVEEQILPVKSRWYQRLAWWTTGRNR